MILGALVELAAAAAAATMPLPCAFRTVIAAERSERLLIVCKDTPELYILSAADGRTLRHVMLAGPRGVAINNFAVSSDGSAAALSWRDGTISIVGGTLETSRTWHAPFYANSLVFSPDGRRLYVDGTELETSTARPTGRSVRGDFDAPNAIAFDRHGQTAVVAEADTTIRLFDLGSGKQRRSFVFNVEPLVADVDPQTGDIIAGLADGSIARFDKHFRLVRNYVGVPGMMPVMMMSQGTHLLIALAPQRGGAQPTSWLLDYAAGKWAELPSAKDAVAAQRRGKSVLLYKLHGSALSAEELVLPSK